MTGDYWTDLKSRLSSSKDLPLETTGPHDPSAMKYISELEDMAVSVCEACGVALTADDSYSVIIPENKTRFTSSIVIQMNCPNCDCPNTFELILYSSGRVVLEVRRYWEDLK